MKKQHEHLGQVLLIYGVAFLTPLGSAVISFLRGEDISKFHLELIFLLGLIGLALHVVGYIFLRWKARTSQDEAIKNGGESGI